MANKDDKNVGKDGLPADTSKANFGAKDDQLNEPLRERLIEEGKKADEALTFDNADSDENTVAKVSVDLPVNPSSTYPGRNEELARHNMALPTEIDLAKRASFAGTQIPAAVHAAGLADLSFDDDAPTEVAGDDEADNAQVTSLRFGVHHLGSEAH